jgi:hypothetical protein
MARQAGEELKLTRVAIVKNWATNPLAIARVLAAAGPRLIETEALRGVPMKHYAATLDRHEFAKLVRRRDPVGLSAGSITHLEVEAWIDAHHLIRRTRERLRVNTFTDVVPSPPIKESFVKTSDFRFGPQPRIAHPRAVDGWSAFPLG